MLDSIARMLWLLAALSGRHRNPKPIGAGACGHGGQGGASVFPASVVHWTTLYERRFRVLRTHKG